MLVLPSQGAKVTLYVTETDSTENQLQAPKALDISYRSADSVTLDETNMTGKVVITNQEESTVTETPTTTPTPSSDGGNSGGSKIIPAATAVANHRRPEMIPRSELI